MSPQLDTTREVSPQNPRVKLASSLRQRKYRDRHGLVIVEGERLIRQSIDFGAAFQYFLVHRDGIHPELLALIQETGVDIVPVGLETLRKVSATTTPQAALGIAEAVGEVTDLLRDTQWIVVADRLSDPGNLGALMRIGSAVGLDGLVTTKGSADIRHPRVIRASAGGYFALPHVSGVKAGELAETLKAGHWRTVVADAEGERDVFTFDWTGRVALVIGNEATGPDPAFRDAARVRIPMPGGIESLNAAVAAGILLYQAWAARHN